ncbi:hypothetical protein M0R45_024494 [Rubus argutus]|uniref:Uncharacterized protein n=1 Tax=Rubus argutus TaxID=59490 RepID=A0AAW1WSV8_RUBAR
MKHNTHQLVMEITVLSAQGLKNSAHFSQKLDPSSPSPLLHPLIHHASFFSNRYSCINLQLYTKRLIMGRAQLGWCQIPAYDIVGFPSTGAVKYLSYRLRARDGTRTHGIVNVAVKLENLAPVRCEEVSINAITTTFDTCGTVIGTPVAQLHLWPVSALLLVRGR